MTFAYDEKQKDDINAYITDGGFKKVDIKAEQNELDKQDVEQLLKYVGASFIVKSLLVTIIGTLLVAM